MTEGRAERPYVPEYGIPKSEKGTLPWTHVTDRLERARQYWIVTADGSGRPHSVPTWGVWLVDTLYFGGGPHTRWSRNLASNPQVAVHLAWTW